MSAPTGQIALVAREQEMIIRAACEADAPAMGQVMVTTYLAAHRDQMPEEAWAKRAEEWTAVAAELAHKG